MSLRRVAYSAAPAIALLGVALGLGEWSQRQSEAKDNIRIPWDVPALKYEFTPGGQQNSHGFNERELAVEKPAGTLRVAALGDSVTHGAFVPSAQAWPRQLENQLAARGLQVQALNFGVYGYDTESIAAQLRHRVAAWEPDLVVYGYYVNDPMPTELVTADGRPVYVGTGERDFRVLTPALDAWLHRGSALFRRFEGAAAARAIAARPRGELVDFARFDAWLGDLAATARDLDVPLLMLAIPPHVAIEPDPARCNARGGSPNFCRENLDVLARSVALAEKHGIEVIDGLAAYRAAGPADLFGLASDPHHPNAEGHRRLATALAPIVAAKLGAPPVPASGATVPAAGGGVAGGEPPRPMETNP